MNRTKLLKEFTNAVEEMKKNHESGTYYWYLGFDGKNNWAIVLGWSDGFEPDATDPCMDGTWRLCAKMAYQHSNSIMQCDYDIDWLMPYDEITEEVDDNEVPIYPNTDLTETIDWLLNCYHDYNY